MKIEKQPWQINKWGTIHNNSTKCIHLNKPEVNLKFPATYLVWIIWCAILASHCIPGLYSLSGKTSYRKISWSLEAARFGFKLFQLLWNLTGTSAAALPRYLSNFRAIRPLQHPISRLRDFTRFGGKTSYRLVNRGPGERLRFPEPFQGWYTIVFICRHSRKSYNSASPFAIYSNCQRYFGAIVLIILIIRKTTKSVLSIHLGVRHVQSDLTLIEKVWQYVVLQ